MRLENQKRQEQAQDIVRHPVKNARKALAHQRPDGVIGEWELIDRTKWSAHQRIAAKTLGVVTVANAVSLLGAGVTASGIRDYQQGRLARATAKMGVGRSLDLVDGLVAKKFGTRSVTGAGIDAGADKLLGAYFLTASARRGDLSPVEAGVHLTQQARIAYENFKIKQAGGEPNPSENGKHGQMFLWLRAGGTLLSQVLREQEATTAAHVVSAASEAAMFASVLTNEKAVHEYHGHFEEITAD